MNLVMKLSNSFLSIKLKKHIPATILLIFSIAEISPAFAIEWYETEASHHTIERLVKYLKPVNPYNLTICENYGCSKQVDIQLSERQLQAIRTLFKSTSKTSKQERQLISRAIALFEQMAGRQSHIYKDRGKNYQDEGKTGYLDCIAESLNTYIWLTLIESQNLLHWHKVDNPIYRKSLWSTQHWAVSLIEKHSNQVFVVDSWYQNNGFPAVVMNLNHWNKDIDFPLNNPVID